MSFPTYPAYKDSGVEWLGEVPDHWESRRLKFLFSLQKRPVVDGDGIVTCFRDGAVTLRSNRRTDGFTNAEKEIGYQGIRKGDLVIHAMDAFAGAIGVSDSDGKSSPVYSACTPNEGVSAYYFARLLRHMALAGFVSSLAKGIRERSTDFRWSDASEICLPLPSISEQTQIARFLDHETARIDALIEEQQRLIELLKEKRQAVISHAVTKGLDPTVPMKDSGVEWLGEVPAHWVVSRAKLVSDIFVPQRNKPELNDSEGIPWVTMEDMNGGYISATNLRVTEFAADEAGSKVLKKGAVIASCVGRFGIVAINAVDVVINQQLQAFEPRKIKAEYLRSIVSLSKEYFELIGTAATLVYVNQQGFENLPVLIPSACEQESICLYVDEANARFDALLSQSFESIRLLQERRAALISAAVTGKIDVRSWQPPASIQAHESAVAEAV